MTSINDFPQQVYEETFEATCAFLEERQRTDPTFTIDDIKDFLKDAYTRQGDNWIGRGLLHDTKQAAIIAAYECVLAEWQDADIGSRTQA